MNNINSISQFHRLLSLPDPLHPLVSVVNVADIHFTGKGNWESFCLNFYCIALKRDMPAKMKYGRQYYDFDKGLMTFTAPKQVHSLNIEEIDNNEAETGTGHLLMVHPDFLYRHPLAKAIKNYGFFLYTITEALHLSDKEEKSIEAIFHKIVEEYQHIDRHTQDIILSQVDLLLQYCNRFYERQFITRKAANHDLVSRTELLLSDYYNNEEALKNGIPTVEYLAGKLNISPHYLSDTLRTVTGQGAQQHIHQKLIEKAKEQLVATNLSVAQIAYQLGFEYPQSFNKLFKKKTDISPLEFRKNFK